MSMTAQTWSLNALSVELGVDRRVLARKLERLAPAVHKKAGGRTEKRWYIREVISHLSHAPGKGQGKGGPSHDHEQRMLGVLKLWCSQALFPHLIEHEDFAGLLSGHLVAERKMSKIEATETLHIAVFGILRALAAVFDDPDMDFRFDDDGFVSRSIIARNGEGLAAFIARECPVDRKRRAQHEH